MIGSWIEAIKQVGQYREAIAIGVPLAGVSLAASASVLTPRGKAKALITGSYLLLQALGAAFLLFALIAAIAGEPIRVVGPLLVPGIVLTVIMGIFSPEIIRQYQHFELRKLAAEIFRRS